MRRPAGEGLTVAHAYTPGLRVTADTVVRRERRLPLRGKVMVERGQTVDAATVVARTELPGNVQTLNLASKLGVDPAKTPETLVKPLGSQVKKGEVVAQAKSLFGLVQNKAETPVDATLESVSHITGQLVLRESPIPVEVNAFVAGLVIEVLEGEGVVVEARAAFVQGIFGVGGETHGEIAVVAKSPDQPLEASALGPQLEGKVVVGGFDDSDLRQLLGRDLGVAITGSEDLGVTLVLTEGFGHIRMADRTWKLLTASEGRLASVSGATQIRAGVMRPEILIPRSHDEAAKASHADHATGLEIGSSLRVIRQPHFGRIGRVSELPPELQALDSEATVRVLAVEFVDGARAVVPRANVELIAE